MAPLNNAIESADALVALRTNYYSQLPRPDHTMGTHKSLRHMMAEDTGVVGIDQARIASNEIIGRQAFLLDEPLWQAKDGRILRLLLESNTNCRQRPGRTRGDSMLRDFDVGPISTNRWRLGPELEGVEEYQKVWVERPKAFWRLLELEFETTGMESVTGNSMNTQVVALQAQPPVRELHSEALADEMYCQYIDEDQCCELGGWLKGN